jgi:hypothetical protein
MFRLLIYIILSSRQGETSQSTEKIALQSLFQTFLLALVRSAIKKLLDNKLNSAHISRSCFYFRNRSCKFIRLTRDEQLISSIKKKPSNQKANIVIPQTELCVQIPK